MDNVTVDSDNETVTPETEWMSEIAFLSTLTGNVYEASSSVLRIPRIGRLRLD